MLNVYFTIQQMRRGFPLNSQVMLIKHRKLADRPNAFCDVLVDFADRVNRESNKVFAPYHDAFAALVGNASAKGSGGASAMVGDVVLVVSFLEGEECEVARRAY